MVKPDPHADQTPDLRELAGRLNQAIVYMHRQLRQLDSSLELPPSQLFVLAVLVALGSQTIGKLAQLETVTPPTMTRTVASLEERGLAVRIRSREDLRVVRVEATPAGHELMARAESNRVSQLAADLAELGPTRLRDVETAVAILNRLRRAPSSRSGGANSAPNA